MNSRTATHEPFSDRDYYPGPELVVHAKQAGLYSVIIWNGSGHTGDYVAVIGEAEAFSPSDLVKATVNTIKIRKEGELHGPCTPLSAAEPAGP